MTGTSRTPYAPLDTIRRQTRLVRVHPGENNDALSATLIVISIPRIAPISTDTEPVAPYEAISYTWGNTQKRLPMNLNNCKVSMPASAVDILRFFRGTTTPIDFWIDAISIDQSNLAERASQVSMMGSIYENATQTRIWLGEEDAETQPALEICTEIGERFAKDLDSPPDTATTAGSLADVNRRLSAIQLAAELAPTSLGSIFRRNWFQRVWVIQEAALAHKSVVFLGSRSIPWLHVLLAGQWLERHGWGHIVPEGARGTCLLLHQLATSHNHTLRRHGVPLSLLVFLTESLSASESRDYFYGLLSLTSWSRQGSDLPAVLRPDYETPVAEIMANVAKRVFIEEATIIGGVSSALRLLPGDMLSQDDLTATYHANWPSWQGFPKAITRADRLGLAADSSFNACSALPADVDLLRTSLHDTNLPLRGHTVDEIGQRLTTGFRVMPRDHTKARKWLQSLRSVVGRHFSSEEDMISFLAFDVFSGDSPQDECVRLIADCIRDPSDCKCEAEATQRMAEALVRIKRYCCGRRLLRTKSGRLAIGGNSVLAGDHVVLFHGARTPFILRSNGANYTAAGPCFVRGIMQGEALRECQVADRASEVFNLQ